MPSKCTATNRQGKPCGMWALKDAPYCTIHDPRPESVERRRQAAIKAGQSQQLITLDMDGSTEIAYPTSTKPLSLSKPSDVRKALARVIRDIHAERIDFNKAKLLLYGLQAMTGVLANLELPERLEKLERLLRERGYEGDAD